MQTPRTMSLSNCSSKLLINSIYGFTCKILTDIQTSRMLTSSNYQEIKKVGKMERAASLEMNALEFKYKYFGIKQIEPLLRNSFGSPQECFQDKWETYTNKLPSSNQGTNKLYLLLLLWYNVFRESREKSVNSQWHITGRPSMPLRGYK